MARGRNSHHGAGGRGGALLACDRAIERRTEYESSVKKVQARALTMADILREGSDLDAVLKESGGGAEGWLASCRDRLKAIAEGNSRRMDEIGCFVDAVKEVRADVERRQTEGDRVDAAAEYADAPDYERSIHEANERIRAQREGDPSRAAPEDGEMSVDVRIRLGEKVQRKRSRSSRGGGEDEDDDDLEVVQNRVDDVHALKCPITGMLFEDPIRNSVCGHTYDRAGLNQMLGARKTTCPVPGCANKNVSLGQVEEDEEMKLKVKRHKTREEAERRKRELENEEQEDEGNTGGYTVL